MRKIESAMIAAIISGRAFKSDNTEVTARYKHPSGTYRSEVKLHGHVIAELEFDTSIHDRFPIRTIIGLCGWNTATTRSRLNRIIDLIPGEFGIDSKSGIAYLSTPYQRIAMFSDDRYLINPDCTVSHVA